MIAVDSEALDGAPLSPQQKHLWLLQQGDGVAAYRTRASLWIEGRLEPERLRQAFAELIERHEILRTSFVCLRGMKLPFQIIRDTGELSFVEHDLSGWSAPEAEAARLLRENPGAPFDLEEGPSLRLTRVVLSRDRQVYRIELPALCADARGLRCLVREAARLYERGLTGRIEADEESLQYADLAAWMNEMLTAEEAEAGRAYWRRIEIADLHARRLPRIPGAKPGGRFQPASVPLQFADREAGALATLARRFATAPGELLLAAWIAFLGRLTQRTDALVGVTFEGRDYAELESAIGLFARSLIVRCETAGELRLRELAEQVRQALADARHWQECFACDLLFAGSPAEQEPFFPFAFEDSEPEEVFESGGARFSIRELSSCCDRFTLRLRSSRGPEGWSLFLDYDAAHIPESGARQTAESFRMLLASAVREPEAAIGDLEILTEAERRQLLEGFQPAPAPPAAGPLIHRLFEQQAAAYPERPAVVDERRTMTFGELEERSGCLARRLRRLGAGPGTVVAICLDRSLDVVVALLGALRAGAAYAPLDPAQPRPRLAFMLEDLRAPVVIAERSREDRLPETGAAALFLGDEEEDRGGSEPVRVEPVEEDLAYVIFTSGSTGRPKGVGVEHRHLRGYLQAILGRLELPEAARFALVSTFAADLGHTVLFPALATGGCLHVISHERASDPAALAEAFRAQRVDCLKIVPGHLGALLAASPGHAILPGSQLVLGGEACSWELIDRIRSLAPSCSILNHYGPTETTVGVLTQRVEEEAGQGRPRSARVPLGLPLAGTRVDLVDERLRLVPAGAVGEICIGGRTVARGYVSQPALTAERFLPDPFSGEPGARLYRTGDLGRRLPDGVIEFLGRADHQVKIRGYRVELGEIEAALLRARGVLDAVVMDCEGGRLVAYIEAAPEARPDIQRLRESLAEALPDYMVPASFVVLDAFRRTANGKVDRLALPAPQQAQGRGQAPTPPRNRSEQLLLRIWEEVLGRQGFGVHDNFFELGGDSILSIRVVARANRAGLHLTPRQTFEHQTVAALAAVAEAEARVEAEQGLIEGPVPLTPIQHLFFEQDLAEPYHWNQSVLLKPRVQLEPARLERVIAALLRHHDALRLRFRRVDGSWFQVNAGVGSDVPFGRIDLSALPADLRLEGLCQGGLEAQRSLDLTRGPILRCILFDLGPEAGQRLLIAVHHLAMDGVSWRILLDDLQTGYLSPEESAGLPAKTTSFRRWSELLGEHAQSEAVQRELDEWRRQPDGGCARLPLDGPGAVPEPGSARQVSVSLDAEETRILIQDLPRAYQTQIQDVLLAALARALAPWTGERPVRVDLEGHGREEIFPGVDLSRTIGWFTTIYPVLLDPAGGRPLSEVLTTVRERLRRVPRRGIGYGLLRYLGPAEVRRVLAEMPRTEIRVNYLGQLDEVLPESSLFAPASEHRGAERSPAAPPRYLLDLLGRVERGCLRMSWVYSESVHRRSTVEALAQRFVDALGLLVRRRGSFAAEQLTPADFPDAGLDRQSLDLLLAELGEGGDP